MREAIIFCVLSAALQAQPTTTHGNGAPTAACVHRDRYVQDDGTLGHHIWACINSAGTQGGAGVWTLNEYLEGFAVNSRGHGNGAPAASCYGDAAYTQDDATSGQNLWKCVNGTMVQQGGGGGGSLPAGVIVLIVAGSCPTGYTEATALNGVMVRGTLAANADVGTTGGADTITPTGTNGAPGFTGTAATLAHAGTAVSAHSGTAVAAHVFTQPTIAWPIGVPTNANESTHTHGGPTISWPAGVPTNAAEAAHTHTYTDVVNHVHVQNVNSATVGGLNGYGVDTSTNTSSASGYSTANPTGGVASGTTAAGSSHNHTISWPAGVPTNGATGAGAAHTHTVSWPVGVPTNSGGAVDAHSVTQPAAHTVTQPNDHSYTPLGSVAAPGFTGNSFDNRPAFVRVIFCKKS